MLLKALGYTKHLLGILALCLLLGAGSWVWSEVTSTTSEIKAQLNSQVGLVEAPRNIIEAPGETTVETADSSGVVAEDAVEERPDETVNIEPGSTDTRLSLKREPTYFPDFERGGVGVQGLAGSDRITVTSHAPSLISIRPVFSAGLIYDGRPGLQATLSPLRVWGIRVGGFAAIYRPNRLGAGLNLSTRVLHERLRVTAGADLIQRRATVGLVWDL